MTKICPICDYPFKNGDKIVAVMLSTYKAIDSSVNFAITQPTVCLEIAHDACYDYEDMDDANSGEILS
jgi:hypothetical protein